MRGMQEAIIVIVITVKDSQPFTLLIPSFTIKTSNKFHMYVLLAQNRANKNAKISEFPAEHCFCLIL